MKSARQVKQIVGHARLEADGATDERILRDAGAALAQTTHNRPQALPPGPTIWRMIMESKATRYSVAATLVVAASLILTNPFGSFGSHGVALGEVAERVGQMQTATHQEKRLFYEQGKDEPFLEADVRKYISTERGEMEEQYDRHGTLMYRAYMLKPERRMVLVFPPWKRYLDLPLDEAVIPLIDSITPKGLIDYFTSREYRKLGCSQFDGHDVEGFEIDHAGVSPLPPQYRFLIPFESVKLRLWVDVHTSLPVGVEMEINSDRSVLTWFKKLHVTTQAYNIQWDAPIPAGTFDPNIPADYKPLNLDSVAGKSAAWLGVGALPAMGFVAYRRYHP
jgi:hypothetical protein